MKRLLRIGASTFVLSIVPIISWFLLGLTLDGNLVNIFSLTYPVQFVFSLFICVFASGANIKQAKEGNKNAVLSGMTLGAVVGGVFYALLLIFNKQYIQFLNMDVGIYKHFAIYSFTSQYVHFLFSMTLEKMYFEDKDKIAYRHSLIFNIMEFVVLIGSSLIVKNDFVIIGTTITCITIYALVLFFKQFHKFKLDFNILTNFKYESTDIVAYLLLIGTYFFGYSNAFEGGAEYVAAINFVALITDAQWDCCNAMSTVAKIDIANGKYNYKQTMKNCVKYTLIIMSTSIIAFFALFKLYNVDLKIGLICLLVEVVDFIYNPITYGFEPYVQLEYSAVKNTTISIISYLVRFLISSFVPIALCTVLGQFVSSLIGLVCLLFIRFKVYRVKDGNLVKKVQKNANNN